MIHCYNKQTCTQLRNTEQELLKTLIILYIFRSLEMKRLLGQRLYQKMLDKLVSWLKGMFNWKCLNCLEILIRYLLSVTIEPVVKIALNNHFFIFTLNSICSRIHVELLFLTAGSPLLENSSDFCVEDSMIYLLTF